MEYFVSQGMVRLLNKFNLEAATKVYTGFGDEGSEGIEPQSIETF